MAKRGRKLPAQIKRLLWLKSKEKCWAWLKCSGIARNWSAITQQQHSNSGIKDIWTFGAFTSVLQVKQYCFQLVFFSIPIPTNEEILDSLSQNDVRSDI